MDDTVLEPLPEPEATARAAARQQALTWFVGGVVTVLALAWMTASLTWFVLERDALREEPGAIAGSARSSASDPLVASPAPTATASPVPVAPTQAAELVYWGSPASGGALDFVGVDIEPVWGAGFTNTPVGRVTKINRDSGVYGFICPGDLIISVNEERVSGLNDTDMTRNLETALFGRARFEARVAPQGARPAVRLIWGSMAATAPIMRDVEVVATPRCPGSGGG